MTRSLEDLLAELDKLRCAEPTVKRTGQIREGVALAVKLADLLRRIAPGATRAA